MFTAIYIHVQNGRRLHTLFEQHHDIWKSAKTLSQDPLTSICAMLSTVGESCSNRHSSDLHEISSAICLSAILALWVFYSSHSHMRLSNVLQ